MSDPCQPILEALESQGGLYGRPVTHRVYAARHPTPRSRRRIWWWPELRREAHVLELGSGAGAFERATRDLGWTCDMIEPRHGNGAVTAETWARSDPPSSRYDAAFAWQVVEHLIDPWLVCRAVRKALIPAGYFVLSVPSTRSLEHLLAGRNWEGYFPRDGGIHRWAFSPRTIQWMLGACGFTRVRVLHQRVVKHTNLPPWATFALGSVLAALHCSGRITVVARP